MSEIIINEVVTTVDLTVTEIITTQTIVINEAVGILEVVAGANVTVDNTNPLRPVVSASGGGGGAWGSITGTLSDQTDLQSALDDKLDVGATTAGINPSTDRNYVTDAQQTVIENTSGTNTGDNATNSQYSGLASSKEDTANKSNSLTDIASTTKFPVWSIIVTYITNALASFKTDNFLDATSSIQGQLNKSKSLNQLQNGVQYFNDFIGSVNSSSIFPINESDGVLLFIPYNSGSFNNLKFADTITAKTSSNYGILMGNTNASVNSVCMFTIGAGAGGGGVIEIGVGEIEIDLLINFPVLSNATETYWYNFGIAQISSTNPTDFIGFVYAQNATNVYLTNNTSSVNWQCVTVNNSTRTVTNSGVVVNASAFQKLSIRINADATSVQFLINNILVQTHTTNIPSGNSKKLYIQSLMGKLAGTSNVQCAIDYIRFDYKLATPRI